jgi:hypothetical protein
MVPELRPRLHPTERTDALRYVGDDRVEAFVRRQRAARLRVVLMDAFYVRYPCRMGALHRLAAAGIAVARFAAVSEAYHAIGDGLCPSDAEGRPRTPRWEEYVAAFEAGHPADLREELWLRAHLEDMEQVKAQGWVERFAEERDAHRGDPMWERLDEHMRVTLGTRLQDREALAGEIALETAIASSLAKVVRRQLVTGLGLVRTFVAASAGATLRGGPWVPPHLPSDRRLVWALCRATAATAGVGRIWRLGVRRRDRGAEREGAAWSLRPSLEAVLTDRLEGIDPDVLRLFEAMHHFRMTASVHLYHRMGRGLAWMAALLLGQGMYEEELDQVPARFRLFRRDDGSLHFVREFWCDEAIRVFDSDFVVREVDGHPTLLEVFVDLGLAARMRTEVLDDGGLSMEVVGLFVRGLPVGVGPARVCFETRPCGDGCLDVSGVLDLEPTTRLGDLLWHRWLGLPRRVGEIRYRARPADDPEDSIT